MSRMLGAILLLPQYAFRNEHGTKPAGSLKGREFLD
jgi:hypothetical protein